MKHLIYSIVLNKNFLNKFLAFFIIGVFIYLFKSFLLLFFLCFVFGYLFYACGTYIHKILNKLIEKLFKKPKAQALLKKFINKNLIITLLYVFFIFFFVVSTIKILPKIVDEIKEIPNKIPFVKDYFGYYIHNFTENVSKIKENINQLEILFTEKNINIINKIINNLKNMGNILLQVFLAYVLSYFFVIERKELKEYFSSFKIGFLSQVIFDISKILGKIAKWFGLIFKAQAMIAITNTVLTTIGLFIIGYLNGTGFPYLMTISLIVFVMGFIPVAGTFFSSIPIIIIGFTIGGLKLVVYCIVLILLVHALEAYFLNPKIVSGYVKLPVTMTFLILIVSEHLFGIIGLLIGVPLFLIIVDSLVDIDNGLKKLKKLQAPMTIQEKL